MLYAAAKCHSELSINGIQTLLDIDGQELESRTFKSSSAQWLDYNKQSKKTENGKKKNIKKLSRCVGGVQTSFMGDRIKAL